MTETSRFGIFPLNNNFWFGFASEEQLGFHGYASYAQIMFSSFGLAPFGCDTCFVHPCSIYCL